MRRRAPFVVIAAAGMMNSLVACTCNGCSAKVDSGTTMDSTDTGDTADTGVKSVTIQLAFPSNRLHAQGK